MKKFICCMLSCVLICGMLSGCVFVRKFETEKEVAKTEEKETPKEEPKEEPKEVPAEKPAEPENKNLVDSLSYDERYEMNIFLSNFSEAGYDPFSDYTTMSDAKLSFVFNHALINSPSNVEYFNSTMGFTGEYADKTLKRFFGSTLPHDNTGVYEDWYFEEGWFVTEAASGEFYGYFSVVTSVYEFSSGEYEVEFNIYTDHTCDGTITNKSLYGMTNSQAEEKYTKTGSGRAAIKSKVYNGKNTYEIVSYDAF